MKRNEKKYKVFSLKETDELKQFVEYCKSENKVMSKELLTAIKYYLQHKKKGA